MQTLANITGAKVTTLTPASFTIQHVNLRNFASLTFTYSGLSAERGTTVVVQDPVSLISRRDGRWTVRARNSANTRTIRLDCGTMTLHPYKGKKIRATV